MGKKSKRSRNKSGSNATPSKPPALRTPVEETKDNLQFEDPFIDEAILEEEEEEETANVQDTPKADAPEGVQVWNPYSTNTSVRLEMDESAYLMHHALSVEWPCLSFDFIQDSLGKARTRFPHTIYSVAATQAPSGNKIQLMKLSDLDKIKHETEDDVLGEEYDKQDDDNDDTSSDEESVDLDPILESFDYPHSGASNRVRVQPHSTIVSSWSDNGNVYLYDVEPLMQQCSGAVGSSNHYSSSTSATRQPFFTYSGHSSEGFAMDWSPTNPTHLATGSVDGTIHIWQPSDTSSAHDYSVTPMYESEHSVEDLQWSPTESTVLAACDCGGVVNIYDTRAPHKSMISNQLSNVDINVMSWNRLVGNLLSTGDDDGVVSVWDLRNFQKNKPLARFTSHQTPITSLEWHPTDESMLAVTDDVGAYVYDLSVEEEYTTCEESEEIPPQLLFCHKGSELFKEVHWHPQISSCLMTTALGGFSVFIPSNL